MNLKRFLASDVRSAIARVRDELGPDAVILSNRRVSGGIEIVAAIDYDESLVRERLSEVNQEDVAQATTTVGDLEKRRQQIQATTPVEAMNSPEEQDGDLEFDELLELPRAPGQRIEWSPEPTMLEMRREVAEIRKILEIQLSSLAWNEHARNEPVRAMVLRELTALDLCPVIAKSLVKDIPAVTDMRSALKIPLGVLAGKIPVAQADLMEEGGVVAVVGPTGVGKTTSIVKIAARFALRHGPESVGLISMDNYRIGAREQLLTFARILGVPMRTAKDAEELNDAVGRLSQRKLVLIDTAGMSQRDVKLATQFATLRSSGVNIKTVLAVSAASELGALREIVEAFSPASPVACVLTKLDEAASIGAALSVVIERQLPLLFLADGQRIPEDLHVASTRKIWLVREALRLKKRTGKTVPEQVMAEKYGAAVANG